MAETFLRIANLASAKDGQSSLYMDILWCLFYMIIYDIGQVADWYTGLTGKLGYRNVVL